MHVVSVDRGRQKKNNFGMGKIRSAWEIALERTQGIEIDEEKIRQAETMDRIKRIAGSYLSADVRDEGLLAPLSSYDGNEVRKALKPVLMGGLSLPGSETVDDRMERLDTLARTVMDNPEAAALYSKLLEFLKQYTGHKKQLVERLRQQLEPMLKQKQAQLSEQYGRQVNLRIEDDKEALEIINNNLEQLDKQYNDTLDKAKKDLEKAF